MNSKLDLRMKTYITYCIFAFLLCGAQSCTVGYSFTGAAIPPEANTFSVKTFQIAAPLAPVDYPIQLTESLRDLMLSQTSLDLVEKRGDLQYEGVITKYEIGSAAVSSEEITSVNRLTISIKIKYTNTFNQEKNLEKTLSAFADYNSSQNFNSVESGLIEDINEQLTQDVFNATLGAW